MATEEIKNLVVDYAYGCGINPNVAIEQIRRESSFNPAAVGTSGERGIAQFMPGTWERFGYGPHANAHDVNYALDAWCAYMIWLLNRYGWNYEKALQAYNGGEGNVDRGSVSSAARSYASEILSRAGADQWGNPWPGAAQGTVAANGQPQLETRPQTASQTINTMILIGALALVAIVLARD